MKLEMNMSVADIRREIANFDLSDGAGKPVLPAPMLPQAQALVAQADAEASPTGASAAVVENTLLAFDATLSEQQRQDVTDCVQYATLVANKKFPGQTGSKDWYEQFRTVVNAIGLVPKASSSSIYQSLDQKFTMDQAALAILESAITAALLSTTASVAALKVAKDAITAMKAQEVPLSLFERQIRTHSGVSFNIGSCVLSETGEVDLIMAAVNFSTASNVTNVLFWHWSSTEVNLYQGQDKLTLSERQYSELRGITQEALLNAAKNLIATFGI